MDHTEDVARLFSWLKTPLVHYRDFAPQLEVAEAVATWPIVHKAAVQTGMATEEDAPRGASAAKERIARDRMTMPAAVAEAIRQSPPPGTVAAQPAAPRETPPEAAPGTPPGTPLGGRRVSSLGERVQMARAERALAEPEPLPLEPLEPRRDAAEPTIAGFEQPAPEREPSARRAEPYDSKQSGPAGHYPARERAGLFGGEYRGREREARPGSRVADRQDRSLDAVFSRLSGARDGLPDPRGRARTTPGLGAVFGRLR